MNYTNRQHSNYLAQADGPILASDGLLERVANENQSSFTIRSHEIEASGVAVSFSTFLNTGVVKIVIRTAQALSPIDVMKFQGKCTVDFGGSSLPGIVVAASSNFEDSTFEFSFMPDGDT